MSVAVVELITDGLQERRMQRSSMMLFVEAERSSRSRRESQRICNSSVSWELRGGGREGKGEGPDAIKHVLQREHTVRTSILIVEKSSQLPVLAELDTVDLEVFAVKIICFLIKLPCYKI